MKTAILGGTFDPPHLGHLFIASEVASRLNYEKILFVPVKKPPHKNISRAVSDEDRLNMLTLATNDDTRFSIERYEIARSQTSYTIDTLNYLYKSRLNIDGKLGLIIGSDLALTFDTWKSSLDISNLANIIVVSRGIEIDASEDIIKQYRMTKLNIPRLDISSSLIRERVKINLSVKYLITDSVYKYINSNNLYK